MDVKSIHHRVGHVAISYKHYILVWGGFRSNMSDLEVYCPTDEIWFYNCTTEVWYKRTLGHTNGYLPFRNSGSTAVVCEDYLYIYGGVEELTDGLWRYSCELHRLDLKTLTWSHLTPSGTPPQGCDKGVGWVHDYKIYFFGGYGQRARFILNGYSFDTDTSNLQGDRGWNNQLTVYDPRTNSWSSLKTFGTPPRPRAAHAADLTGDYVYVFGGRLGLGRVNDLYVLNLKTMTWSNTRIKGVQDIPEGRSWHSFNFVSEDCAIVYGGLNQQGSPCTDWWECKVNGVEVSWKHKGKVPQPLVWHKATLSSITNELIIVGGVSSSPYVMREENHVNKLHVIQFTPTSLLRLCLREVIKKKLWKQSNLINLPKCLMDIIIARTEKQPNLL